jgi:hypothetical protein
MPGGGMDDFMRQHRRQFRLALQFREQPAIDRQLAAGQCPGIGHRIVDDDEFEGQVGPVADLDQLLPDLIDVGRQRRIEDEPAARRLLGMQILLFAEPDFLLLGDEADFALFGHRVGGTTRRQQDERQGGSEAAEAGRNAHFHGHPNNGLTRPAVDRRRSAAVRKGYRPRRCRGPGFPPYLRGAACGTRLMTSSGRRDLEFRRNVIHVVEAQIFRLQRVDGKALQHLFAEPAADLVDAIGIGGGNALDREAFRARLVEHEGRGGPVEAQASRNGRRTLPGLADQRRVDRNIQRRQHPVRLRLQGHARRGQLDVEETEVGPRQLEALADQVLQLRLRQPELARLRRRQRGAGGNKQRGQGHGHHAECRLHGVDVSGVVVAVHALMARLYLAGP